MFPAGIQIPNQSFDHHSMLTANDFFKDYEICLGRKANKEPPIYKFGLILNKAIFILQSKSLPIKYHYGRKFITHGQTIIKAIKNNTYTFHRNRKKHLFSSKFPTHSKVT
jgi:hypothetical protein